MLYGVSTTLFLIYVLIVSIKKINITKIRTNSYELHNENGHWKRPKKLWEERICNICDALPMYTLGLKSTIFVIEIIFITC
jgi:hypothetical protein